jgi:hypothetical protein
MYLPQTDTNKWTVIGYGLANTKGHNGLAKHGFRALNCRTGEMGPVRDTYDEAAKDFK